jgi:cytochrome c oxidase subunit 2
MSLKFIYKILKSFLEIPIWSRINFQNASSPLIEQLIFFNNHAITILILIITIVGFSLFKTTVNKDLNTTILESHSLELFWTVIPTIVLLFIGFPSIRLLYLLDEVYNPVITIKTIGHQWYWSYEYSDFLKTEFDSYMLPENTPRKNLFRLIDVDNRTVVPFNSQIRNLITAADVLHSWTVPRLGVKVDAVPGRLNQVRFFLTRPGLYFGQCSEICGANHRFIPIAIESSNTKRFISWIKRLTYIKWLKQNKHWSLKSVITKVFLMKKN